ncbi:MAG: hypothetical protein RIB86_10330, partial [Imperialibacter sp.]
MSSLWDWEVVRRRCFGVPICRPDGSGRLGGEEALVYRYAVPTGLGGWVVRRRYRYVVPMGLGGCTAKM